MARVFSLDWVLHCNDDVFDSKSRDCGLLVNASLGTINGMAGRSGMQQVAFSFQLKIDKQGMQA
jgi:hypothetical protein